MIPIVSITDFVNGVISAAIAVMLISMYDRTRREGILLFAGFYLCFAVFWLLFAATETVFFDAPSITISAVIGYVFGFAALFFLIQIPFLFLNKPRVGIALSYAVALSGFIFLLGRIYEPALDAKTVILPYVFWGEAYSSRLRIFPGLTALVVFITFFCTFFYLSFTSNPRSGARRVAIKFCLGSGLLLLASTTFYFFSYGGFFASIISSVICIIGLIIMLFGVVDVLRERKANQLAEE